MPTKPTLLIDTDALVDLDAWESDVAAKRWLRFYLHIPEASVRHPALLDAIKLAVADDIPIAYSSRWPDMVRYLFVDWLTANGLPLGCYSWRRSGWISAVDLAATHAGFASRPADLPVLVVHNDAAVAADLRSRGIAALTPGQLPSTVAGLRRVFALARPVPRFDPKKKRPAA